VLPRPRSSSLCAQVPLGGSGFLVISRFQPLHVRSTRDLPEQLLEPLLERAGNSFQGPGIYKTIAGMDFLDPHAAVLSAERITITGKRVQVDKSQLP
jgi:hypothetical protein